MTKRSILAKLCRVMHATLFMLLIVWKTKWKWTKNISSLTTELLRELSNFNNHVALILNEMELQALTWRMFQSHLKWAEELLSVVSFKCYLTHLVYDYLAVAAYISISVTSLSRSKWQKTVQNPELILSRRCQTDDPVLLVSGFNPSVENWDAGGKCVREALAGRKTMSHVTASHCPLTSTIWSAR